MSVNISDTGEMGASTPAVIVILGHKSLSSCPNRIQGNVVREHRDVIHTAVLFSFQDLHLCVEFCCEVCDPENVSSRKGQQISIGARDQMLHFDNTQSDCFLKKRSTKNHPAALKSSETSEKKKKKNT